MDLKSLHQKWKIIDGHADTFFQHRETPLDFFSGRNKLHLEHTDLQNAGQNLQIMAVFTPENYKGLRGLQFALDVISAYYKTVESRENRSLGSPYKKVLNRNNLEQVCLPGNSGFLLFMEGATPLAGNIDNLPIFYELGIRGITLTHNFDNEAARGCLAEGKDRGLTPFGKDLIREMETMSIGIDLAHSNEEMFWEVIRKVRKPVIDSHTGLRAIRDFPRNLTDDQVRAVADTGGVICISFVPDQLKPGIMQEGKAEISDVVKNILHGIKIAGIDHIGLGADWDGFDGAVSGLETPAKLPALSQALLEAGLSEEETGKIMGGNMYRFLSDMLLPS